MKKVLFVCVENSCRSQMAEAFLKIYAKEVIQTASQEELTSHLGYEKHQETDTTNYRNGHSNKTIKSKYGNIDC